VVEKAAQPHHAMAIVFSEWDFLWVLGTVDTLGKRSKLC
jgi:hypothetical protein